MGDEKRPNCHTLPCQLVLALRGLLISAPNILGRLKYLLRLSTYQKVDLFMPLYRYAADTGLGARLDNALLDEVNDHMATIERELIRKVAEVKQDVSNDSTRLTGIESVFHQELEALYSGEESIDSVTYERVTEIQCVVDKIREYTESRKFYAMKQAIEDVLSRIEIFHSEFSRPVPPVVFAVLKQGLNTHLASLEAMRKAVESVVKVKAFPVPGADLDVLAVWAESLESFSEEFEDNQEFFSSELFSNLEVLATKIVLECRVKKPSASGSKEESYRRRIRYAAGFLLNVIEASQEEADYEDAEVVSSLSLMSGLTLSEMFSDEENDNCHSRRDNLK